MVLDILGCAPLTSGEGGGLQTSCLLLQAAQLQPERISLAGWCVGSLQPPPCWRLTQVLAGIGVGSAPLISEALACSLPGFNATCHPLTAL